MLRFIYKWLSPQKYFQCTHIYLAFYINVKKSTYNQKSFTNVFLMHTQIFIVLNICNKNPQIYVFLYIVFIYILYLKSICNFHQNICGCWYIHIQMLLFCEPLRICVWIFLRLPWRGQIHKCIFSTKGI